MFDRRDLLLWSAASALGCASRLHAADPLDVLDGAKSADPRLGPAKTLNGYFPFTPPKTVEEWAKRKTELREQLLVALGLWPMPEKTPLNPVVHGSIRRGDEYTIEKVFFASRPGHFVTGNLYRPIPPANVRWGPRPGILFPHGHWKDGRQQEGTDAHVKAELDTGAEQTPEGARFPLQAGCVGLVRQGFVVFHFDTVGTADSTAIPHVLKSGVPHPQGFADAAGELRLQSLLGLQMWNAIRALDFLESLPGVDPKKLGVAGASGGGTQTMLLCAIDDRPAAAVPMVMVSTAMQGGCPCENCSLLRVGTGNVEFAGLFAPKPLAMTGADDWTKEIMTKGYPELKQLYALLGAEDKVSARAWPEFKHNMNQPAREFMESWFCKQFFGRGEPVREKPFTPVPPKELSVYDADHPRPADELDAAKLRAAMAADSDAQMAKLAPTDAASLDKFRAVVGTALWAAVGPSAKMVAGIRKMQGEVKLPGGVTVQKFVLGRRDAADAIPTVQMLGPASKGKKVVIWVHPGGKGSLVADGKPTPTAQALLDAGFAIFAPDLLGTGEQTPDKPFAVDSRYAGFTFGYNRSLLANRVRDVLAVTPIASTVADKLYLVGWGEFGPVAVLARALAGDVVSKTAADLNGFRFDKITDVNDLMMLPGAVKYGGLPAFLALCAPGEVLAHGHAGTGTGKLPAAAYAAAGAEGKLTRVAEKWPADKVVRWVVG